MSAAESSSASIGKSVEIRGEVKGNEDLSVDGVVEGTITLVDSRLTIGPTARVNADVSARDVVILGTLNGNVRASVKVDLRKGANLNGDISAVRLSIEEGSFFSGRVDLTQTAAAIPASAQPPAKSVPAVPLSASASAPSVATPKPAASAPAPPATGGLFSSAPKP